MSGLSRLGAVARRGIVRLIPAERRDWVEAVWAEAPEVSSGPQRLVWRAGAVRLIARELLRRRLVITLLFALAAGSVVWEVWPGAPANPSTGINRVTALTLVALLVVLAVASRFFLGPTGGSQPARYLRVGAYIGVLALIPARAAIEVFAFQQPTGGVPLLLYRAIEQGKHDSAWPTGILLLVVVGLYATAIFWITSQRSRVVPTTLLVGTVSGLVLGLVMYVVAPLGLSKEATNPWLPGSDIDPLAFLAWMLVLFGPCIAGGVAYLRYMASKDPPPAKRDQARQAVVAGLLANLVGALLVTVLGNGTVALMINAPWLRNWLYHGRHLLYGVAGLQPVLRGHPGAIAYSHEITAVTDAGAFSAICISFLLIAAVAGGFVAMCVLVEAPAEPGNPRRGEGDPPGTEPEPPDGGQMTRAVDYEVESALGVLRLDDRGLSSDQDGPVVRVPDDAVEPVGSR